MKEKHISLKTDIFNAYGNGTCECCGESNLGFLTLDHINNDGTQHRKYIKQSRKSLYNYLRENDFPDKDRLRVLCYNCNYGRDKQPDKVCPHKKTIEGFEMGSGI